MRVEGKDLTTIWYDESEDHIKIIEWPELIEPKPKDRIDVQFQYSKSMDTRQAQITGFGKWKGYEFFKI